MIRLTRILFEVFRFIAWELLARLPGSSVVPGPQRLSGALARLGTTFVKCGQALSLRQDTLPTAYIEALRDLQDHVPPFSGTAAVDEIEARLGRPITELFSSFDRNPLASGSIAQVHAAQTLSGQSVVVKVRRPRIEAAIEADMQALKFAARLAASILPRLRHLQPLRIIDAIHANLRQEIDFSREARNIRYFSNAFADWNTISVPKAIDGFVRDSVIVQERSNGHRIDDRRVGKEGPQLARDLIAIYLHQIFVLGVFHGDPHPGNLFITDSGQICFHDFGLIGVLDRPTRRRLAAFTHAFIQQDADWLLDAAIDLGLLGGAIDRSECRRGLADIVADYASLPLKEWSLADAFLRVTKLGHGGNVLVPFDLLILIRAMFLIEHTVATLDPSFELLDTLMVSGPAALKSAMAPSDLGGSLTRAQYEIIAWLYTLPGSLRYLSRHLGEAGETRNHHAVAMAQAGRDRLALALVCLGLVLAGSALLQNGVGPVVFGTLPLGAALAYGLAVWLTLRLLSSLRHSDINAVGRR